MPLLIPFAFEMDPQIIYDAGKAHDYTENHLFKMRCWSVTGIVDSISNNYKANCQMVLIYGFLCYSLCFPFLSDDFLIYLSR